MTTNQKCPHCGHTPENNSLGEIILQNIPTEPEVSDEEQLIAKIKDQVLTEVRESVEPLLIKLKEITAQQSGTNQNTNPQQAHDQQLKQIQAQAMARMKAKEQGLAQRMQKLQLRTSRLSS